jgi:hypothetical protein
MDNQEINRTKNTTQKTKKINHMDPTKNRGVGGGD